MSLPHGREITRSYNLNLKINYLKEVKFMNDDLDLSIFIKDLDYNCSKVQKKCFKKGEIITSYIAKRNQLCLMLSRRS